MSPTRLAVLLSVALAAAIVAPVSAEPRVAARAADQRATEPAVDLQALSSGRLTVQRVVSGFSSPLGVTHAGDGTGRLFVVQRDGLIRVVQSRRIVSGSFIDARSRVEAGGERGLLGMAFHPEFATNGFVFVFYTRASDGDIIIGRLTANAARTSASLATERILLHIEHSRYGNHNGGPCEIRGDRRTQTRATTGSGGSLRLGNIDLYGNVADS